MWRVLSESGADVDADTAAEDEDAGTGKGGNAR